MLETLRAWLNGSREYFAGVAIYSQLNPDQNLLNVLKKGPNEFRIKRLQEELLHACNELKKVASGADNLTQNANKSNRNENLTEQNGAGSKRPKAAATESADQRTVDIHPRNKALYDACKSEADHKYKEVMNLRAILFKMANADDYQDPNTEAKINERARLSFDVVIGWQKVSQLYDRANYVKLHGRLPDNGEDLQQNEFEHLPDHLVKDKLDNARKALNKLKKKEATPERVALMQKHEENISKLEKQWHSLKPQS